jgi:tetratricopeptide (TPR) repeat protein
MVRLKEDRSPALRIVLFGTVAFVVGAILSWAILSSLSRHSSTRSRNDLLPDVSRLSASVGAVTLGNWYFDHHEWVKAVEQYRKAISLGVDNADVRSDLGSALRFNNQPEAAATEYEIAQRENPEHENSLFNLATLYLQSLNQPARAIALLEQFKAKFPRSGAISRIDELLQEAKRKETSGSPEPNRG